MADAAHQRVHQLDGLAPIHGSDGDLMGDASERAVVPLNPGRARLNVENVSAMSKAPPCIEG